MWPGWSRELETLRERTTLFLSGGGWRTMSFCGALEQLGWRHLERCAGVSAGAMLAFFLSVSFSPKQILEVCYRAEHSVHDGFSFSRVWEAGTLIKTTELREIFTEVLATRDMAPDATFATVASGHHGPALSVVVFCCECNKLLLLNAETTPHLPVIEAVLASIALPPLFAPVDVGPGALRCCDAALVNNTPLGLFNPRETLAFIVRSDEPCGVVPFPQTIHLRCRVMAAASVRQARSAGAQIVYVPPPSAKVTLLQRSGLPASMFLITGQCVLALFAMRHEIAGVFILLLLSPSSGTMPRVGRRRCSDSTSHIRVAASSLTPLQAALHIFGAEARELALTSA